MSKKEQEIIEYPKILTELLPIPENWVTGRTMEPYGIKE